MCSASECVSNRITKRISNVFSFLYERNSYHSLLPTAVCCFGTVKKNTKSRYKDSAVAVPFKFSGQIPSDFVKVNISPIEQERKWT